jgi:hypothetical protein
VPAVQVDLDTTRAELSEVRRQLLLVEEERTAAAKRSAALLAQYEERDRGAGQELASLRWVGWGGLGG